MESNRRRSLVYGFLLLAWVLILGWQTAEHFRVQRAARVALIERAKDISTTLGIVLRAQRRFGGVISRERLESALTDLVKPGDLNGIALLNAAGDVVASSGSLTGSDGKFGESPIQRWDAQTVTVMNLVDLGTNVTHDIQETNPPIVLRREEFFHSSDTNHFGDHPSPWRDRENGSTNETSAVTNANTEGTSPPTPDGRPWGRGGGSGRPRFARPPWMGEDEYKALLQKQGVHSFLIVMSTQAVQIASSQDLWLRFVIGLLAMATVVGTGFAWRNFTKSSDLQFRLVRASELTTHLKEMNLAAAGLAHETRNPLNIIRGMAQMISQQPDAPPEIREKSSQITDEVDRVTAQLNEFINYSRPLEVRRSTVAVGSVIQDVVRALQTDLHDKAIQLKIDEEGLTVEADAQLLRQIIFNLLINSIQAIPARGEIQIVSRKSSATEAQLDVRDNGPGVAREHRNEIFKPYFTTYPKGTGLGLAVVQQVVLAHGWEIQYIPKEPHGAIFRLSRLKLSTKTA
jgi:signal transduction histidine kinase